MNNPPFPETTATDSITQALRTTHDQLVRLPALDAYACVQIIVVKGGYYETTQKTKRLVFDESHIRDATYYVFIGQFSSYDRFLADPKNRTAAGKLARALPNHADPKQKVDGTFRGNGVPKEGGYWSGGWCTRQTMMQRVVGETETDYSNLPVTSTRTTTTLISDCHSNLYLGKRAHISYMGINNRVLAQGDAHLEEIVCAVEKYLALLRLWFENWRCNPTAEVHLAALPVDLLSLIMLRDAADVRADWLGWRFLLLTTTLLTDASHRELWLGETVELQGERRHHKGLLGDFFAWLLCLRLQTCLRHIQDALTARFRPELSDYIDTKTLRSRMQTEKPTRGVCSTWHNFKQYMYREQTANATERAEMMAHLNPRGPKKESKRSVHSDEDEDEDEKETKAVPKETEDGSASAYEPADDDVFLLIPFELRLWRLGKKMCFLWQGYSVERRNIGDIWDLLRTCRDIAYAHLGECAAMTPGERAEFRASFGRTGATRSQLWTHPIYKAYSDMESSGDLLWGGKRVRSNARGVPLGTVVSRMAPCMRNMHKKHIPHDSRFLYYVYMLNSGIDPNLLIDLLAKPFHAEWTKQKLPPTERKAEWEKVVSDIERIYKKGKYRLPRSQVGCNTMMISLQKDGLATLCPIYTKNKRGGIDGAQAVCAASIGCKGMKFSGPMDRDLQRRLLHADTATPGVRL
jgi:hypothetical protein